MALIFNFSAALLEILVQQWIQDYMRIFQRHGDPLRSARPRQCSYDSSVGWYMLVVPKAVPACRLHFRH